MKNFKLRTIFLSIILSSLVFLSCQRASVWPPQALIAPRSNPTPGVSESIGQYASGCLKGGKTFKGHERGLILSQSRRGRFWAHSHMIDLLTELGEFTESHLKHRLVVGDLSLSRGGPTVGGHNSHQNGLDVDLWFDLYPTNWEGAGIDKGLFEYWQIEEMKSILTPNKDQLLPRFGKKQRKVLFFLAQDKRVQRLFVHPRIKKWLCEEPDQFKDKHLRKIRPWYGHDDHVHVRLYCPEGDKNCVAQSEPPEGSGCDKLSWWESDEAKKAAAEMDFSFKATHKKYLEVTEKLPEACQEIYKGAY